jgi:glycosyltransferase involved in cell wall biosynthesis
LKLRNEKKLPDDKPKTIFYVWTYLEWGGVQTYFLSLMRTVSKRYCVKAILPRGSDSKIIGYLKNNNVEYDFFDGNLNLNETKTLRQKIKRRCEDFMTNYSLARNLSGYDLKNSAVQIDFAPWTAFALILYLTLKTEVFVTLHTAIPPISLSRRVLWKTKCSLIGLFKNFHLNASNIDVKKSLRPVVNEKLYREIDIVYSSFSREEIVETLEKAVAKKEIAGKYNISDDKIWICNVGQFIERKGCWILLEAIKILRKQRKDLLFLWFGTAPLDEKTKEKIEKYNLSDSFRFLSADEIGSQRKDLLTLWNANDIFVLPSFQEGLPMALIEAMALGKPCIASDINAIPEAIEHLETGILLKPGDAETLARAISSLADDPNLRKKIGENAQKAAFENFEEKIIGQKMLGLYDNSLQMEAAAK